MWLMSNQASVLGLSAGSNATLESRIELAIGRTYTAHTIDPDATVGGDVHVLFIRATLDDDYSTLQEGEHWCPRVESLTVVPVEARHDDLLDRTVLEQVSAVMKQHLDAAECTVVGLCTSLDSLLQSVGWWS